jgi:hypothetical protein
LLPSDDARELIMEAFRNAERFPPPIGRSDRPARNSQHSQHSLGIHAPFRLPFAAEVMRVRFGQEA